MANNKTVTVQRANVILQVSTDQIDYYLSQGYNVIDEGGNVIKASVPRDLGTLQKAYVENAETIEALKKELAELKAKRVRKKKDE